MELCALRSNYDNYKAGSTDLFFPCFVSIIFQCSACGITIIKQQLQTLLRITFNDIYTGINLGIKVQVLG